MDNGLSANSIKYIISRILENANDSRKEDSENKGSEFYDGKSLAYYEVLNTIKNELEVREQDLKEFGLDINLEKSFL